MPINLFFRRFKKVVQPNSNGKPTIVVFAHLYERRIGNNFYFAKGVDLEGHENPGPDDVYLGEQKIEPDERLLALLNGEASRPEPQRREVSVPENVYLPGKFRRKIRKDL